MRIGDSIPFSAFRAYGLAPRPAPCATPDGAAPERALELVGARVAAPASIGSALETGPSAPALRSAFAYPMYTRAADRVEAAVAVQLGRTVDVRG
jgi:hypothetical protein